jgi:hypothetical protein
MIVRHCRTDLVRFVPVRTERHPSAFDIRLQLSGRLSVWLRRTLQHKPTRQATPAPRHFDSHPVFGAQ